MKKGGFNKGLLILIVVCFLIVFFGALYILTQNEEAKQRRDLYRDRADELKRKIVEKENIVSQLIIEIERLKCLDNFLIEQAKAIYKIAKLFTYILIIGICFIIYAVFNFSFFECLLTIISITGLLYSATTIYFQNKVGNFNDALRILETYFILKTYRKYNFEPAHITNLEQRLLNEKIELENLRNNFSQLN